MSSCIWSTLDSEEIFTAPGFAGEMACFSFKEGSSLSIQSNQGAGLHRGARGVLSALGVNIGAPTVNLGAPEISLLAIK